MKKIIVILFFMLTVGFIPNVMATTDSKLPEYHNRVHVWLVTSSSLYVWFQVVAPSNPLFSNDKKFNQWGEEDSKLGKTFPATGIITVLSHQHHGIMIIDKVAINNDVVYQAQAVNGKPKMKQL